MRRRRQADTAKTISLHHHIVGGDCSPNNYCHYRWLNKTVKFRSAESNQLYRRGWLGPNPYTMKYCCINHGDQRVFQFEIIINALASFFRLIWISMVCVYGHYKCFDSFSAGTVLRRQILTSQDGPRAERVKGQLYLDKTTISWTPPIHANKSDICGLTQNYKGIHCDLIFKRVF